MEDDLMTSTDHPAIVLGLSPTGLSVARSLAPRGVTVYGVDELRLEIGHFSRWVKHDDRIAYLPPGEELLQGLRALGAEQRKKPVLFIGGDSYIDFVAHNREALEDLYILPESMRKEVNSIFLNKRTFYERCVELGVPTPRTFFPTDEAGAESAAAALRYPAIVKPSLGHLFRSKLNGQKLVTVNNGKELVRWWKQFQEWGGDSILQEEIVGPEGNIYVGAVYMDRNLECRSLFTAQKTRQYPPQYGSASYIEASWSQEIADLSIELLEDLGYQGVCGTEYKWDERDQEYKLIEVNCRPTLWYALSRAAGVDVVWDAYCDLIGETNPTHIAVQNDRMRWQLLVRDIISAIHFLRKGELSGREFFRTVVNPFRKEYAVLSSRDPMIWLAYPVNTIFKYLDNFHSKRERH